jgi:ABC-2 type transport system permease protein
MQLNALGNLGALLLAGLGGALTPIPSLPAWARAIAPGTPSYWAMRGFRSVVLDGAGVGAVLLPSAMLLAFAAGLGTVAATRFRVDQRKMSWA